MLCCTCIEWRTFKSFFFLDFCLISVIFAYVRRLLIYWLWTRFLTVALKDIILFIFAKWKHRMIKNNWINCLTARGLKLVQKIKTTFKNITGIWDFNLLSPGSHLSFFTPGGNFSIHVNLVFLLQGFLAKIHNLKVLYATWEPQCVEKLKQDLGVF